MIYTIAEIAATVTDVFFLIWYVPNFVNTKLYEHLRALVVPIILLVYQLIADRLFPGFDLLPMIVFIVLVMIYSLLICRHERFRAILAAASYILAIMFVGSIVYMGISFIVGDRIQAFQGTDSPARIVYLVICKIVEYVIYLIILRLFQRDGATERKNAFFFSVYMLFIVVGLGAVMTVMLDDPAGDFTVAVTIITDILLVSVFLMFFFVHKLLSAQKREYEYRFIEEKIESEKRVLDESNRVWENLNRIRHDLKNHLVVIKGKLNDGDVLSCMKYIDGIFSQIDDIGNLIHTGNAVVDYLINSKFTKENDVQVEIFGNAGIMDDIPDADIVGLIGNLLDNALEAVKKITDDREKRIELYFLRKNSSRIILCKNTVDHPVLESNRRLMTVKKDIGHGYGTKIIDSIVQRHGGFVEYSENQNVFSVHILFQ